MPLLLLTFLLVLPASPALGQSLVFSSNTVTVTEGGTQTYTVKLATQPSDEVTVQIRSQDTGAATVLPLRLTFTTADWETAQTVTVTGVTDPDRASETVTLKHGASGGDYDAVSGEGNTHWLGEALAGGPVPANVVAVFPSPASGNRVNRHRSSS